jgi:ABC-type transport system involved in cytochrome c biogenesis permease subunit
LTKQATIAYGLVYLAGKYIGYSRAMMNYLILGFTMLYMTINPLVGLDRYLRDDLLPGTGSIDSIHVQWTIAGVVLFFGGLSLPIS